VRGADSVVVVRNDQVGAHEHAHLAAQEVKQDSNTLAVIYAFNQCETVGECALQDAHGVAGRETNAAFEPDEATLVFALL